METTVCKIRKSQAIFHSTKAKNAWGVGFANRSIIIAHKHVVILVIKTKVSLWIRFNMEKHGKTKQGRQTVPIGD